MVGSFGYGQYSPSAAFNEEYNWGHGRFYKHDGSKRLVVWSHSAGGLGYEPFQLGSYTLTSLLQRIADDPGVPIISVDGMPPDGSGLARHWGNSTAQGRTTDAINFASAQINPKVDKVILCGVSMGGALALNWAVANPTKVNGIALFYPAVNINAIYNGTGGATLDTVDLNNAYGGSWTTNGYPAYDPAQHTASIAALGVPMKMWYSTSDTTVGTANQTSFATAVGTALEARSLGAVGHADMTQIDPQEFQDFIRRVA